MCKNSALAKVARDSGARIAVWERALNAKHLWQDPGKIL